MAERLPADFFLVPMKGIGGKAIQFGQFLNGDGFDPVQHAGMYLGNGQTIEAYPGGAIRGSIEAYSPDSIVWSSGLFDLTPVQRRDIVETSLGFEHVPYSFLDYEALAAHRFHIPFPGLKGFIDDTGHMICSQLVDKAYQLAGVELFDDGRWPGYVTPGDLYNLVRSIEVYRIGQGI